MALNKSLMKTVKNQSIELTQERKIEHILDVMSRLLSSFDKTNSQGKPYTRDDYLVDLMTGAGVYDPKVAQLKTGPDLARYQAECACAYQHKTKKDLLNVSFALTADEMIEKKIPRGVIGCTGVVKLFCHFAQREGVACQVVATAVYDDLNEVKERPNLPPENRSVINGHQLIGIERADGLHLFDPGYRGSPKESNGELKLKWFKGTFKLGDVGDFLGQKGKPCQIRAIISPEELNELKSYRQLSNLLVSGDMNNYRYKEIETEKSMLFLKLRQRSQGME